MKLQFGDCYFICLNKYILQFFFYSTPKGLEDVSKYPYLFAELVKRNWTEEEVAKVAGLNIIRVFKRTEEVCS